MERYAASVGCRHRHLVGYFGETYRAPTAARATTASRSSRRRRSDRRRAEGAVVRRARRPAVRRRARRQRALRQRQRSGHVAAAPRADDVRAAARRVGPRSARLHRTADRARLSPADRRCVSGGGADRPRRRAAEEPRQPAGLVLARQRRPVKDRPPKRSRIEAESWQDVDRDLFDRLRAVRLEIARARGVPPYVIFHDTTLREMARLRPKTVERSARHPRHRREEGGGSRRDVSGGNKREPLNKGQGGKGTRDKGQGESHTPNCLKW